MGRAKTPSFILELELKTTDIDISKMLKEFEKFRSVYNTCLGESLKRLKLMRESKAYQRALKMPKSKTKTETFKKLREKFGYTENDIQKYAKAPRDHFGLNSALSQKIASRAFSATEKLLFGNAKQVYFKRAYELTSFEAKQNNSGIGYRDGVVTYNNMKFDVIVKPNDTYAQLAIQSPVKYCRLCIKPIRGKYKLCVQLILEGFPPSKYEIGNDTVGIDIGTQTVAAVNKDEAVLVELAPNITNIERQLWKLNRAMDRSRRAMNPNKYNPDGTFKKGNRDKWVYSNHYKRLKAKRADLYRKQTAIRKQDHNKLANKLLQMGSICYVETMSFSGLQKRSTKTEKNAKGKFKKKKRFGKSLSKKAPASFLALLENKLKAQNGKLLKIDTKSCKASQYNHIEDTYKKKDLKERWNILTINNKQIKVQRDLYSAFLIRCVAPNLKKIDKTQCDLFFNKFLKAHNKTIKEIKTNRKQIKPISSMGL